MKLLKYELKELVARDLSIALKRIKETIKHDSPLYNELIMLEGRFLDTINYFNLNLTEKSLIDIEKSKIRRSILEIIDNLNENNILSESLELSWWNELPFEWEQAFEYIIGNNPTEKKVKYLFQVKNIYLNSELIVDLKPLQYLKQIEELKIFTPNVSDYSIIHDLKFLKKITIFVNRKNNNFKNILATNKIENLIFSSHRIDIENLNLPNNSIIKLLEFERFKIKSLSFLEPFLKIEEIAFHNCSFEEFDFSCFDKYETKSLHLTLNDDFDKTIWSNHVSDSIENLTLAHSGDYPVINLNTFIDKLPKLNFLKLNLNSFYDRFHRDSNILPPVLLEIMNSNIPIIDLSRIYIREDYLSKMVNFNKKKKIFLSSYTFEKLKLNNINSEQNNIEFLRLLEE